ncbi:MAG: glycosyltransferase [Ramlibacter sp.]|nr:glycosyltransferase [Ramlibacter sp.]
MPPLVSVLLCTNRVDDYLFRAIESVRTQTYPAVELVLVLNGAAAGAAQEVEAVVARFTRAKVLATGVAHLNHSLNIGLDAASGELLARMDADDLCYADRLSVQVAFMLAHPDVAVCGSWYEFVDNNDAPLQTVKLAVDHQAIRRKAFYANPLCHPSVMYRRDVVARFGGYLGGLFAEDYDLWVRMMMEPSVRFATVPQVLLGYRSEALGSARKSKYAYASMSAAQWNCFVQTGDIRWALGAMLSLLKRLLLSASKK